MSCISQLAHFLINDSLFCLAVTPLAFPYPPIGGWSRDAALATLTRVPDQIANVFCERQPMPSHHSPGHLHGLRSQHIAERHAELIVFGETSILRQMLTTFWTEVS